MFVQGLLFRSATVFSYSIPVLLYISLMTNLKTSFYKKTGILVYVFFISCRVSLSLLGTPCPGKKRPLFFSFLNKRTTIFYSATIITFQLAYSSKNEQFTRVTYAGACLYIFILSSAWKELNRAYKWWIQSVLGYKTTKMG